MGLIYDTKRKQFHPPCKRYSYTKNHYKFFDKCEDKKEPSPRQNTIIPHNQDHPIFSTVFAAPYQQKFQIRSNSFLPVSIHLVAKLTFLDHQLFFAPVLALFFIPHGHPFLVLLNLFHLQLQLFFSLPPSLLQ